MVAVSGISPYVTSLAIDKPQDWKTLSTHSRAARIKATERGIDGCRVPHLTTCEVQENTAPLPIRCSHILLTPSAYISSSDLTPAPVALFMKAFDLHKCVEVVHICYLLPMPFPIATQRNIPRRVHYGGKGGFNPVFLFTFFYRKARYACLASLIGDDLESVF